MSWLKLNTSGEIFETTRETKIWFLSEPIYFLFIFIFVLNKKVLGPIFSCCSCRSNKFFLGLLVPLLLHFIQVLQEQELLLDVLRHVVVALRLDDFPAMMDSLETNVLSQSLVVWGISLRASWVLGDG